MVFMLSLLMSVGNSQYYSDSYDYRDADYQADYDDNYYNTDYDDDYLDYNFGYDSALPYLRVHSGPVYYWQHPYRDIYFVSIGNRIFIIPGDQFRSIIYRSSWLPVAMERFIVLSCGGLHYYDNYVRFNYYYDFYRGHSYSRHHNHWVHSHYRDHYRNRRNNNHYFRDWDRVMHNKRIIGKRTLSPGDYDRYNDRDNKYTGNSGRTVVSKRSYNNYNAPANNNYNSSGRYNSYNRSGDSSVIRKRSLYNDRDTAGYSSNSSRQTSHISRPSADQNYSSSRGESVSGISIVKSGKQSSQLSHSNYRSSEATRVKKGSSTKKIQITKKHRR